MKLLPKLYLFIRISLLHDVSLLALKYQPVNMKPFLCLKQSTARSNSFEMSAKVKSGLEVLILLTIFIDDLYCLCIYVFLIYTKLVRLSSCQGCPTPELQKRANQLVLFFLAGANFWKKHAKNRRKHAKTGKKQALFWC